MKKGVKNNRQLGAFLGIFIISVILAFILASFIFENFFGERVMLSEPVNLIQNPSFESGQVPWLFGFEEGNGTAMIVTDLPSGMSGHALQIRGYGFGYQEIPALATAAGKTYNLTFLINGIGENYPKIAIQDLNNNWNSIFWQNPVVFGTKRLSYSFSIPRNSRYVLSLGTDTQGRKISYTIYYDNVSLVEVIPPDSLYASVDTYTNDGYIGITCTTNSINYDPEPVNSFPASGLSYSSGEGDGLNGMRVIVYRFSVDTSLKGNYEAGCKLVQKTPYTIIKETKQSYYFSSCPDTDANATYPDGVNYRLNGTLTSISTGFNYSDECKPGTTDRLIEYYCLGSSIGSQSVSCATGFICSEGACVSNQQTYSCVDSDDGKSYNTAGNVSLIGSSQGLGYNLVSWDYCINSTDIGEYYCENGVAKVSSGRCSTFCNNPDSICATVPGEIGAKCLGTCISPTTCIDYHVLNDNFLFTKSNVTLGTNVIWDSCFNATAVNKTSCSGNNKILTTTNCPSGFVCNSGTSTCVGTKIVNVTSVSVEGNICGGNLMIVCTTDQNNNVVEPWIQPSTTNISFGTPSYFMRPNNVIVYNYSINASAAAEDSDYYNIGCYLSGRNYKLDSDVVPSSIIPDNQYPGRVSLIKAARINVTNCSVDFVACTGPSDTSCGAGKVCENYECVSHEPPSGCEFYGTSYDVGESFTDGNVAKYCGSDGEVRNQKLNGAGCSFYYQCISGNCSANICKPRSQGGTSADCGNGIKQTGEDCDLGITGNGACPSTCSSTCHFNSCGGTCPSGQTLCLDGTCKADCGSIGVNNTGRRTGPGTGGESILASPVFWILFCIILVALIVMFYFMWLEYQKKRAKNSPALRV